MVEIGFDDTLDFRIGTKAIHCRLRLFVSYVALSCSHAGSIGKTADGMLVQLAAYNERQSEGDDSGQ